MTMRDVLCLVCGRRGDFLFLYLRPSPSGGQHQAVGLCGRKRCEEGYNGPKEART